ncbi:glycosyltransferase [Chloroflexota bacterium]
MPGLVKYLHLFGWQPIILTPSLYLRPDRKFRAVETPYRDALSFWKRLFGLKQDESLRMRLKKQFGVTSKRSLIDLIFNVGGEIINYPDIYKGWQPFAVKAGAEFLQKEKVDAILSSSSPVTSHLIARELKIKHKIPWVADFRDLWSQNHDYQYSFLRRLRDRRLELKTLSMADALVTVSELWAEKLRGLHRGKSVFSITNGFDPEEVNIPPANLTPKFTITYTGTIYTGKQDPTKLFEVLRDLVLEKSVEPGDVEVRFYGTKLAWLDKEIKRYGLSDVVKQYGHVAKEVALEKQKESHLLLLLDWDDPNEKGVYSGKVFEYLGARRPILAIGGSIGDVVHKLLIETKAGIQATNLPTAKKVLVKLYQEYKLKGKVVYNGIEGELNKYSHREMASKFSEIFDHLTNTSVGS